MRPTFPIKTVTLCCAMALGTVLFSSATEASEVSVYGRIGTGIKIVNNAHSRDTYEMASGHTGSSLWGIKATESLTNDLSANVVLESGISADTGEGASQLFSRQSTVSLKSRTWGELALGRSGKVLSGSNAFTRIGAFTPFSVVWGDAGLLFYGKGARIDNGIFYQSPNWNGFTWVASASFQTAGSEVAPFNENERYLGSSLDYKAAHWGMLVGVESTFLSHEERQEGEANPISGNLMGYADVGDVRLFAAYQRAQHMDRFSALQKVTDYAGKKLAAGDVSAHNVMVGAKAPLAGGTLRLSALYSRNTNEKALAKDRSDRADYLAFGVGYEYPFSKRTLLYTSLAHLHGLKGLKDAKNADGDLTRTTLAFGMVHRF